MYIVPLPKPKARRASRGLGQFYPPIPMDSSVTGYLNLRFVDKNGSVIPLQKYYFNVDPDPSDPSAIPMGYSVRTDEGGRVTLSVGMPRGASSVRRLLSITPLFESPFAPKDKAIVWKEPVSFGGKDDKAFEIVNEPGGGLKKATLPAPAVQPPTAAPPKSPAPSGAGEEFPWGVLVVGAIALGLGIIVIPKIFGSK